MSGMSMEKRRNLTGWLFLAPAALMIVWMNFYTMIRALLLSLQTGVGQNMKFAGLYNYTRMLKDPVLKKALFNTFVFLIIQVPIMLVAALILASMLNSKNLRFKGIYRTAIFLPCATSLVSYSVIFRALFSMDGLVNYFLIKLGIFHSGYNWLGNANSARFVIIIALLWRWTGYNMVFYLAGLQNIDPAVYEAARIDGASPFQIFTKITAPLLKPIILLTTIMSTNGTLQLFDESFNLTRGGPADATMTISYHIWKTSFYHSPNFGYASAMSYLIFILVAVLAFIQMRVGDRR